MFDDYRFSNDGNSIVGRNAAADVNHDRHQLLLRWECDSKLIVYNF